MLRFLPRFFVLLCNCYFLCSPGCCAGPIVQLRLQVAPTTHSFECHYTFQLPAADTASVVRLLLNRQFPIQHLASPHASQQRLTRRYYPYFADTMQLVEVRFPPHQHRRQVTFTYSGTLAKSFATEQVMEFSGHSN